VVSDRTRGRVVLAAVLGCGALAGSGVAGAAGGWPQAGGDAGRSGNQALAGGPGVMSPLWTRTFSDGHLVQSGVIVTRPGFAGAPPRVVYGTQDGHVHIHDAYTGAPVGPAEGTPLLASASKDAFRGFAGALTAVDTTDPDGYGQLFVLHNDDDQADPANVDPRAEFPDDIAIAQLDTETGRLVQDVAIPGTDGYTVSGPPLLTEPDATGGRFLIFTATKREDWEAEDHRPASDRTNEPAAFSVPLRNPRRPDAKIDVANTTTLALDTVNPLVPPALLYLSDESGPAPAPGAAAVPPTPFVALATGDPDAPLKLFSPDLATEGPVSPRLDRDASVSRRVYVNSVSVPVGSTGLLAGTKDSKAARAPALIVTSYDTDAQESTVHRLVPTPDGTGLVSAARSAAVGGRAAALLATSQLGGGAGVPSGRIVLATGTALVGLRGSDLVRTWRLDPPTVLRRPGSDGFQLTGPTLVGDAAMLITDDGRPLAVDRDSGKQLGPDRLPSVAELEANHNAVLSPAVGSGVVVFAGDRGLVTYRTACGNRIDGSDQNETFPGTLTGDDVRGRGGIDRMDLRDGDDCAQGGAGDDRIDGGDGIDELDGGAGLDLLLGGAGRDRLDGGLGDDQVLGADGDDTVQGGEGDDLMKGAAGNDLLQGGGGNDRLTGGEGDDRLEGGSGNDRMKGNAGNDTLDGGSGRDKVDGGEGNDTLSAGPGGGELIGAAGDDTLDAANGRKDIVRCGAGTDTATVDRFDDRRACESVTVKKVVLPKKKKAAPKRRPRS
jgi:Ca2+-binding RTX toxin-like protein